MELTLTRTTKRKGCTLGVLAVDGKEMCDTMEPTWRDLKKERKVKGCTAIPEGRYPVVITLSPKFGKWLPLLLRTRRGVSSWASTTKKRASWSAPRSTSAC